MAEDGRDYSIATVDDKWYIANADKLKEILGISEREKKLNMITLNYNNRLINNLQKIEKLKKNTISLNTFNKLYDNHKKRIEKLEKRQKRYRNQFRGMRFTVNRYLKNHSKKLSGLKKSVDAWIDDIRIGNKQRFELKERVEGIYKSIHGIAPDQPDIIKEVLQGFLKLDSEPWDTDHYVKILQLLKKLNGGEKTVKGIDNARTVSVCPEVATIASKPPKECRHYKPFSECIICSNKEKPPEQDAGSARQTEDVYQISLKDDRHIYYKGEAYDALVFKIVEKADLEKIKKYNRMDDVAHCTYMINEVLEKYLTEEAEKKE